MSDPNDAARMTFTGHLGELRTRLVRTAIAIFVGFIVCYSLSDYIITALAQPLRPLQPTNAETIDADPESTHDLGLKWTVLNPLEPVLVKLKIAAYAGLLFAFPYVLYHICAFVFPGLTAKERRGAYILIFGCSALATTGVAVAYWGVFPLVLPYLITFVPVWVDVQLRMNETLSLLLKGMMGFALAFQFPMIVLVLVYMDILSPQTLKDYRRVAIVGMFVGAALLTPPDPLSMCMMAGPLVLLYEASIWLSYLVVKRKRRTEES